MEKEKQKQLDKEREKQVKQEYEERLKLSEKEAMEIIKSTVKEQRSKFVIIIINTLLSVGIPITIIINYWFHTNFKTLVAQVKKLGMKIENANKKN